MKHIFTILVCLTMLGVNAQNNITRYLDFGEYPVGYRVIHTYDQGRSYFPKYDYYGKRTEYPTGRPMQISVWYPARSEEESVAMPYKGYIAYSSSQINFKGDNPEDRNSAIQSFVNSFHGSTREDIKSLLENPTHARLNAEELDTDFPLVLYAPPMNTSATDNSIICEYLASKGYIILSVMAKGAYTELQQRNMNEVQVQAEDLAFLLSYAKRKYTGDMVGVFGFSLGGLANIIFALKNKAIDATICLDGSVMSPGWLDDFRSTDLYTPRSFTSNLLFIGKNLKSPEQNPAEFLEQVKYADKALIRYDIEDHNYFSGLTLLAETIGNEDLTDNQKETNYRFYAEITNYVGRFFDQYLKGTDSFKAFPETSYEYSFSFEKGHRKPLDPVSISQLIVDKGFPYVDTIIKQTLDYDRHYLKAMDWRSLLETAYSLKNMGRTDEAIETLLLADRVFPDWYVTHHTLGTLYLEKNNTLLAEKHFRIALEDHPKDEVSLKALRQMKIETPDYRKSQINDLTPYLGKYIVDDTRFRRIYIQKGDLYIESNYWDEPVKLWPYRTDLFLVESENPKYNMQLLFQFNEHNEVVSLCTRGLNSGRINDPNKKVSP